MGFGYIGFLILPFLFFLNPIALRKAKIVGSLCAIPLNTITRKCQILIKRLMTIAVFLPTHENCDGHSVGDTVKYYR